MWKNSSSGGGPQLASRNGNNTTNFTTNDDDDDWETDPDYINDVSEHEQRWGGARSGGGAME